MAYARRALCFEQWPTGDQAAVTAARVKADPLDDPGLAAHWRPKTVHTVMTHYGLWLAYLMESGQLDPSVPPAARAARANLAGYLADLRARGLASITIAGRFRDLREALRVMQPGADLSALDHLTPRLEAVAEPSRAKRLAVVLPVLLLNAAIAEMTRQQYAQQRHASRRTAERYRDALIVAFLATRPVRLANLAAIILGQHLTKVEDVYWCRFTAQETKNSRPLAFPMPKILTAWIDEYLAMQRPLLLRGVNSLRLWISLRSTPMMDNSIYYRVTTVTKRLVGKPINPHLFRDCVATFIAEESPEEVRIISQILGHAALSTAEEYYIQAGMLTAQRRYLQTIEEIRQLPGAEGE